MPKKKPSDPAACPDANAPAGSPSATCPLAKKKVTLVELVEVVTRSTEGVVTGAGSASAKLKTMTDRADKSGDTYKQYINIGKDVEGADKRHPEHDRYIELKARIE